MELSNLSENLNQDAGLLSFGFNQDVQSDRGTHPRLYLTELAQAQQSLKEQDGADVVAGLSRSPKSLPPKYFYDDRGSQLFEQITALPEYYLTRTEASILQSGAGAIATLTGRCELVELGSGSSTKTRYLLDAYAGQSHTLRYVPIDVSGGILQDSAHQLLADYPNLEIHGLVGTYEQALNHLPPTDLSARMICFLGSTLGNLTPTESKTFLQQVTMALSPGDYFLLGVDLQKDKSSLEAAYNDQQGITAAFNLNMLAHLNQKFDGNFDLNQFQHIAFYNDVHHQIEIYLKSLKAQSVRLKQLDLTLSFEAGELLMTEISRKFNLQEMADLLSSFGLQELKQLTDTEQRFGLGLYQYR